MTTVSHQPARPASPGRMLRLTAHQFRADFLCFRRNIQSVFFTLLLPVLFLVVFGSIFRNATVKVPGGVMKESAYYVPAIIAYGLIAAAYGNLAVIVVRYRESGVYKRRRATPVPAGVIIASRAVIAVLTALAITVILLLIGWAAYGAALPGRTAAAFVVDVIVGAVVFSVIGFALTCVIGSVDAAQPVVLATMLPLSFISGVFVAASELPTWLADIGKVFPVQPLAAALLAAYNPHTTGSGFRWGDLGVLAAWGAAALIFASLRFRWLPRAES
jgi:ABC-2 type transport system permease protein